jgi:hypothetical protein
MGMFKIPRGAGMSIKPLFYTVGGGFVLWFFGRATSDYRLFAGYLLVVPLAYYISLRTHPIRNCWTCEGNGTHFGWFWDYGRRKCTACEGSGRKPRLGVRLLGLPHESWTNRRR